MMKLSIIIPCYNEEEVLHAAFMRVHKVIDPDKFRYEIIFINDGSQDKTLEILEEIAKKYKEVKVISFSRNFGHQPAVAAGLEACNGDVAIILDADMQDPPEIIPDIIQKWQEMGVNGVYAVRKQRKGESLFKRVTAKIFYRLLHKLSDVDIPMNSGDFRLIDRTVINQFCQLKERKNYIRGIIAWLGFKQVPHYYVRDPRLSGDTKYSFKKMIHLALNGILSFTKKPLEIISLWGGISFFIGGLIFLASLVFLFIPIIPFWIPLIVGGVFILLGIQLFFLGILGLYIGMILDEIKERPEYIVSKKINL